MVSKKDLKKAVKKGKKKLHKATKPKSAGLQDLGKVIIGAAAGVAAAVGIEKLQDKKTRTKLKKDLKIASDNFRKEMEKLEKSFAKEYPGIKKELLAARKNLEKTIQKGIDAAKDYAEETNGHTVAVKKKPVKKANAKKTVKKKQTKKTARKK